MRIRSDIALPELPDAGPVGAALPFEVTIRRGEVIGPRATREEARVVRFSRDSAYFAWFGLAAFHVNANGAITVDAVPGNDKFVRFVLIGPILAAVMMLRGLPLLHGSAVAHRGTAILFVGHKRAGKSTTAAAFAASGCRFVSDDVLPILRDKGGVSLVEGFSALKVTRDARQFFLPRHRIVGDVPADPDEKLVVLDPDRGGQGVPLPVGAVVVLDAETSGPAGHVGSPLEPGAAFHHLLQHGYALKFGKDVVEGNQGGALFETCVALAQGVPVLHVRRPEEMAALPALVDKIIAAVETQSSGRQLAV